MSETTVRKVSISDFQFVLKNAEVAFKGNMACIDTSIGEVVPGATSTTLVPIGVFTENLTGDGTALVNVSLFNNLWAYWFTNDTGTPVVAGDIGSSCYIKDATTVTGDNTGTSVAGLVVRLDTLKGVLVSSTRFGL